MGSHLGISVFKGSLRSYVPLKYVSLTTQDDGSLKHILHSFIDRTAPPERVSLFSCNNYKGAVRMMAPVNHIKKRCRQRTLHCLMFLLVCCTSRGKRFAVDGRATGDAPGTILLDLQS